MHHLDTSGFEPPNDVTFETFVNVDTEVVTTAALSNEGIVSMVRQGDMHRDDEEMDDSPIPPPPPLTAREAEILRQYFESRIMLVNKK